MIKRLHDDFFELKSGDKTMFFKFQAPKSKKIIIQHPYNYFDPLGGELDFLPKLIYNKTLHVDYRGDITFIKKFQKLSEQRAVLREGYILWYWTGYWTALKDENYFIGSGLVPLENAIGDLGLGKASYCLTNRDSITIISFEFNNGLIERGIIFDFFINNAFLPYVDTINPFLLATKEIGKNHIISEKKSNIFELFNPNSSNEHIHSFLGESDRLERANIEPEKFVLKPIAYVRDKHDFAILVIINNEFCTKWNSINSVKYIVGNCSGGFIESDFTNDKNFSINCKILFLNDNILIDSYFQPK